MIVRICICESLGHSSAIRVCEVNWKMCSQPNIQTCKGALISTSARYLIHEGAFEGVG